MNLLERIWLSYLKITRSVMYVAAKKNKLSLTYLVSVKGLKLQEFSPCLISCYCLTLKAFPKHFHERAVEVCSVSSSHHVLGVQISWSAVLVLLTMCNCDGCLLLRQLFTERVGVDLPLRSGLS